MARMGLVLLLGLLNAAFGIYSPDKIRESLDGLRNLPILENSKFNLLTVRDLFALSNQECPVLYSNPASVVKKNEIFPSVFSEEDQKYLETLQSAAKTVVESFGVEATATMPSHIGLDATCSDKLCNFMEYLLSCKALNLGIKKRCAQYLLGSFYGCSQFPNYPNAIYNAPSICLVEYATLLQDIAGTVQGKSDTFQKQIEAYLLTNFTTNACGRRCFQSYQYYSNDFYLSCSSQIKKYSANYPIPALLQVYQQFRNQACATNPANVSCYGLISKQFSSAISNPDQTGGLLGDYYCNYAGLNNTVYDPSKEATNVFVFQLACAQLSTSGCCAGTGLTMAQLNQIGLLKGKYVIIPPCFLNYFRLKCPTVQLNNQCTRGSMANQAVIQGYFTIPGNLSNPAYPDVYSQSSILKTQGIITGALSSAGFGVEPYNFNLLYPFQVFLIGYTYYNSTGGQLTPKNGQTAWPLGSDYNNSVKGTFYYQIVMQNTNTTLANKVTAYLVSDTFKGALHLAYSAALPQIVVGLTGTEPREFVADPLVLPSTASRLHVMRISLLLSMIVVVCSQLLSF